MKPKTWADLARSLDEGILLTGVTRAGMTQATRKPAACLNACWLTLSARAAPA